MLITSIHRSLNELSGLLQQLTEEAYACPCHELSNATIGQHTRHVIELFQCLENQYESGIINYDLRLRDKRIETNTQFAMHCISEIGNHLNKTDKKLELQQIVDGIEVRIKSNYFRELLYNLEHCIHHQALIKVAIIKSDTLKINENFGVARSTIEYRNQCAQ